MNGENAVDKEQFITDSWANIKPYLMMDSGLFKPPSETEPADDETAGEEEGEDQLEGTNFCATRSIYIFDIRHFCFDIFMINFEL